jgi:hypothetical protein
MDPEDADEALEARPPLLEDLVSLCRNLNSEGARYVVIGGMAVIQAGFGRATNDIDLLIDTSQDNQGRVRRALMALPDQAVRDMTPDDLERYVVVRVADEIVIDLMKSACGITYAEASRMIAEVEIEGVPIPFACRGSTSSSSGAICSPRVRRDRSHGRRAVAADRPSVSRGESRGLPASVLDADAQPGPDPHFFRGTTNAESGV